MKNPSAETLSAPQTIPAKDINLPNYKITIFAEQLQNAEEEARKEVGRTVLEMINPNLGETILGPKAEPEVTSDTGEFPLHNTEYVSAYFDETTDTFGLMVDTYGAMDYAKLEDDPNKSSQTVTGLKRVLALTKDLNECALNKYGIKQGLKLEHLQKIKDRTEAEIEIKQAKLAQERQKVHKSEDTDLKQMQTEIDQLSAASQFLSDVLAPSETDASNPDQSVV